MTATYDYGWGVPVTGAENIFWCTYLVMKAYQEAGENMPQTLALVLNMKNQYFVPNNKYVYNGTTPIKDLPVGTAVIYQFYGYSGHVAIITAVYEDSVTIAQSNSPTKTESLTISSDGKTLLGNGRAVEGFGLPPCATITKAEKEL